jgi:carbamoyl-phosphate synthase small subunit
MHALTVFSLYPRPLALLPFSSPPTDSRVAQFEMPHQRVAVRLVLQDGTTYDGFSFGATTSVSGELVFSTAMVGYPEALTDPSYAGQMLVCTYPLIGNYGVPSSDARDAYGVSTYFESDRVQVSALIVSEYCFDFSHYTAVKSLHQFLKEHNVPGIYGIDTRAVTKRYRVFCSSHFFFRLTAQRDWCQN